MTESVKKGNGSVWMRLGLAGCSVLFTISFLEVIARIKSSRDDSAEINRVMEDRVPGGLAGDVKLGQVLMEDQDRFVMYRLRPRMSYRWLNQQVTINSRGFRSKEYAIQKPNGARRIIGSGDSVIWGWGVSDNETYLALLERKLNSGSNGGWQVINMGVPGYNTVMEVRWLEREGLQYGPDIVIINYVANDFDPPPFFKPRRSYYNLSRSFLAEMAHDSLLNILNKIGRKTAYASVTRRPEVSHLTGWPPFAKAMRKLAALAANNRFIVIIVALEGHMPQNVEQFCDRLGFLTCYPFDAYAVKHGTGNNINAFMKTSLYLSPEDPHPSSEGHALAADAIYAFMTTNGLLSRRSVE